MAAFDSIFQTTIGTSAMQSTAYTLRQTPELRDGQVNGYVVELAIDGWIEGSSPTDLAAKLVAFHAACKTPAQNLRLTGINAAVELDLPAAQCLDGGPFITCEVLDGVSPLQRRVRVTATARQGGGPEIQIAEQTWRGYESRKVSTEKLLDVYDRVTISGELRGPNLDQLWAQVVLPRERLRYPFPAWTISHRVESNTAGDRYTYQIRAEENAEPAKFVTNDNVTTDDVTTTVRREVDQHSRTVTTHAFDAAVFGDPAAVEALIRPAIAATGRIVRESFETVGGKAKRVRASYTVLASNAAGGVLLEWTAGLEVMGDGPPVRAVNYEGMRTVLLHTVATEYRVKVSGRAVGVGRFVKPPDVEAPDGYHLAAPPTRRVTQANRHECETSWSYEFVGVAGVSLSALAGLLPKLAPPAEPQAF